MVPNHMKLRNGRVWCSRFKCSSPNTQRHFFLAAKSCGKGAKRTVKNLLMYCLCIEERKQGSNFHPKCAAIRTYRRGILPAASRAALRLQSREIYYMSRDHPNAHELTNHIRHPSPAPGLRSPGAPRKVLRMRCGIVQCHRQVPQEVCPGYSEWK